MDAVHAKLGGNGVGGAVHSTACGRCVLIEQHHLLRSIRVGHAAYGNSDQPYTARLDLPQLAQQFTSL